MLNKILLVLLAPIAVPTAIVLGLTLVPAAAFLWLTFRRVARIDSELVACLYALIAGAFVSASIAWPVLAIYGANQL